MARLRGLLRGPTAADYRAKGIVTLRGPLFDKDVEKVIERQIMERAMPKFEKRVRRKGRGKKQGLGRKRNPIGPGDLHLGGGVVMVLHSTKNFPRTTGYTWTRYNIAAIKKMAPNVLRSLRRKIVAELGGGG